MCKKLVKGVREEGGGRRGGGEGGEHLTASSASHRGSSHGTGVVCRRWDDLG